MIKSAEGRTDRDGGNGDAGVAGDDVSRGAARPADGPRAYLRQNAQAFHPDSPGRQSGGGAVALRFNQGADHFSGEIIGRSLNS